MAPELLIRPTLNDHEEVADLVAPGGGGAGRPITRLVVNAQDVVRRPEFSEIAASSGTPLLIDPMTMLLQAEIDPQDAWVRHVSYGRSESSSAESFLNALTLDTLVAEVIQFQVEQGATAIVPPYFYCQRPDSPEFEATLAAIGRTARRMRLDGVALPLVPVLCAQLQGFAQRRGWQLALDRFAATAVDVEPQTVGLCFSPVGGGAESYSKVLDLLVAARRLRSAGARVIAWRQGTYGPALVVAGLDGYECGMGVAERADVRGLMNSRKPKEQAGNGFTARGVFVPGLGRSVAHGVARVLFEDRRLKGRLICDSVQCCPHGVQSMLSSKGRSHAVRARSRGLRALAEIPNPDWRFHQIAKDAASAFVTATKANEVLAAAKMPNRVETEGYRSLEQVAEFMRSSGPDGVRDSA